MDCLPQMLQLQKTTEVDQVELKAVKEAYNQLQEENKRLSAVCNQDHNTEDIPNSQVKCLLVNPDIVYKACWELFMEN